ncbi:Bin3-type SAM domain-containing protein [Mycena kentingensis (nom. inval.)]|nr:Bin3-type SAM domain-containing protein [Mycena kentingensis (nom. inval.)]
MAPVPIHGNYHGYYAKRPFVNDPRLDALPPTTFPGKRVLDVGCNEGWVSCEIAQSRGAVKVLGVDIDDTLIRGAWRRRRAVWSAQGPREEAEDNRPAKRRKLEPQPDYFPASCLQMHGPLPIPTSSVETFPHNLAFRTADWVNQMIPEDEGGYDVVLGFSITKWIHLNGGDTGLERFFARVASVLSTGGQFVVEPQPWDTYRKAKRMDNKLKETAQGLKLRPDDFPAMLSKLGFGEPLRLGSVGEGGFNRPIDVYTKL